MGFNFPNAPAIGDYYPVAAITGVPQYQWDGEKWVITQNPQAIAGAVRYDTAQALVTAEQTQARTNIGAGDATLSGAVRYDTVQALTSPQIIQARQNIYAAPVEAMADLGLQINGNVDVIQALGGFFTSAGFTGASANYYYADNWKIIGANAAANFNVSFGVHAPTAGLLTAPASTFITANNALFAQATIANGDYYGFRTHVEGYRTARLMWGTALAQPLWYGFRFYCTVPGTLLTRFMNATASRNYSKENVVVAGWNWVTGIIPGDTAGTWDKTTGIGLMIDWYVGGKAAAPVAPNAWTATASNQSTGSTNFIGATNNTTEVTGLILLPGSQGPIDANAPNIMRPFDEELTRCLRYYTKTFQYAQAPGDNVGTAGALFHSTGTFSTAVALQIMWQFRVLMRVTPTMTAFNPNNTGAGQIGDAFGNANVFPASPNPTQRGCTFGTAATAGTAMTPAVHAVADARF